MLQAFGADAHHQAVVQLHAPHADAQGQGANGATVDASQAGSSADADAFAKRGNDFNLLFAGKYVHGSSSFCVKGTASREAGNTAVQGVYCPDGHSQRAHPRGV
jgi:hypothetical protein